MMDWNGIDFFYFGDDCVEHLVSQQESKERKEVG